MKAGVLVVPTFKRISMNPHEADHFLKVRQSKIADDFAVNFCVAVYISSFKVDGLQYVWILLPDGRVISTYAGSVKELQWVE